MGAMTSVMIGLGAIQATQQIIGGFSQQREAEYNAAIALRESRYNASVLQQQVGMIEDQKNLANAQWNRRMRFAMGKTRAAAAGKGFTMSGSPAAIAVDTLTQMEMDKAIDLYNLDVQKYGVLSERSETLRRGEARAARYRRKGETARMAGFASGLTTLYKTGAYAAESSFDLSVGAKRGSLG